MVACMSAKLQHPTCHSLSRIRRRPATGLPGLSALHPLRSSPLVFVPNSARSVRRPLACYGELQ